MISAASGAVLGVMTRKPIQLQSDDERKQSTKIEEIWLDIGATDRNQALRYVRVGDPVTLESGFRPMLNERVSSPGMDDKAGVCIVFEAFRRTQDINLQCALYAVSTVQEEVGLRGAKTSAYRTDPDVGIAIDVCHATDIPTADKKKEGDIALDKGPVIYRGPNMNPAVTERLIEVAKARKVSYQLAACGSATRTDANSIQIARSGVAAGLIGVPCRYIHSPGEMVSLRDLDAGADLLAAFLGSLNGTEEFRPQGIRCA